MKQFRIHKNDKVVIIAGKDSGKVGKVIKLLKKSDSVIVEGVNKVKRHTKPNPYRQQPGGIVEKDAPINISNVMFMCDSCSKAAKVGYRYTEDGKRVRFCKKCNEIIE